MDPLEISEASTGTKLVQPNSAQSLPQGSDSANRDDEQNEKPSICNTSSIRNSKQIQWIEAHPRGYPKTAVYINSDLTCALFRRFGDLHARSLLYKEVELTELEEKLATMDEDDNSKPENRWRVGYSIHVKNGRRNEERKSLMEEIDRKLEVYDNLLLRDSQLRKLPNVSKRIHRNFMDWIYTENSIGPGEQNFIFHENDFISLQEYEDSWLDNYVFRLISYWNTGFLIHIFSSQSDRQKTNDPDVCYSSTSRVSVINKILIAITASSLLLVPVFVFLAANLSSIEMTGFALVFAFAFAILISLFTAATRQEVFAATAAYCGVLVVFIGNLQQSQLQGSSSSKVG